MTLTFINGHDLPPRRTSTSRTSSIHLYSTFLRPKSFSCYSCYQQLQVILHPSDCLRLHWTDHGFWKFYLLLSSSHLRLHIHSCGLFGLYQSSRVWCIVPSSWTNLAWEPTLATQLFTSSAFTPTNSATNHQMPLNATRLL